VRLADPLDQATGLRRLFAADPAFRAVGILGPDARRNARFTAGMALALGRRGSQALILDEASAPHNVASLLGILTRRTLADGVRSGHLTQAIHPAAQGVDLLAAQDGIATLARIDERAVLLLADGWRSHAEAPQWLLLNSMPGSGQGLSATADLRVLVLPGSKTRLAEAYTVMKSAHTVWPGSAWLVVVEGAEAAAGEQLFAALRETAQRFLGIQCNFLGTMPRQREGAHPILAEANVIGHTHAAGGSAGRSAGRDAEMGIMAERLASLPAGEAMEFEQYWQRMWLYCRMTAEADMKRARDVRWSGNQG
jgi:MinD-like ATPase involved in chromosome partitioning or flagellar assembly